MEDKKPYYSKTLWFNLVLAVLALIPGVGIEEFIQSNPQIIVLVWAGINMALRFITKGKIQLSE